MLVIFVSFCCFLSRSLEDLNFHVMCLADFELCIYIFCIFFFLLFAAEGFFE